MILILFLPLFSDFLSGICGGRLTVLASVFAYIVDVCSKEQRTLRLTIAEGVIFAAAGFGSGGAGLVARHYSLKPVFYSMVSLQLASFLYVVFLLKESNPRSARKSGGYKEVLCVLGSRLPVNLSKTSMCMSTAQAK